jgi:hypothetical protein
MSGLVGKKNTLPTLQKEGKAFWQLMDKTPTGEVENSPLPMLYPET